MSDAKPTPEQKAVFDAKLQDYEFDTSEYIVMDVKPKHCCLERRQLADQRDELLAALKQIGAEVCEYPKIAGEPTDAELLLLSILINALAAIARAEGGA